MDVKINGSTLPSSGLSNYKLNLFAKMSDCLNAVSDSNVSYASCNVGWFLSVINDCYKKSEASIVNTSLPLSQQSPNFQSICFDAFVQRLDDLELFESTSLTQEQKLQGTVSKRSKLLNDYKHAFSAFKQMAVSFESITSLTHIISYREALDLKKNIQENWNTATINEKKLYFFLEFVGLFRYQDDYGDYGTCR